MYVFKKKTYLYLRKMARLTKEDWLAEGIKILSEFAQNKLRILYLCERLKVTRGSFYHHFESIDDYISSLMKKWEEENTLEFIRVSNQGDDPLKKMNILDNRIGNAQQTVEAAIRSWSFYNPLVKEHLDRVDQERLAYLEKLFIEMGYKKKIAVAKAKIEYGLLIGLQQLNPNVSKQEMQAIFEVYRKKE